MNEKPNRCINCNEYNDGRCMYCDGAEINDANEEFTCMYFSEKDSVNRTKHELVDKDSHTPLNKAYHVGVVIIFALNTNYEVSICAGYVLLVSSATRYVMMITSLMVNADSIIEIVMQKNRTKYEKR